ncbi:MAG: hypothetical protein ABL994_26050, partial [Verrucomicrobiales bacterium]
MEMKSILLVVSVLGLSLGPPRAQAEGGSVEAQAWGNPRALLGKFVTVRGRLEPGESEGDWKLVSESGTNAKYFSLRFRDGTGERAAGKGTVSGIMHAPVKARPEAFLIVDAAFEPVPTDKENFLALVLQVTAINRRYHLKEPPQDPEDYYYRVSSA